MQTESLLSRGGKIVFIDYFVSLKPRGLAVDRHLPVNAPEDRPHERLIIRLNLLLPRDS